MQKIWILKSLKLTSGFDQVDARKKKYSSTISPVTFKLMMACSNYCFLWTDDSPHSATPTAVGNRGPGTTGHHLCHNHLRTTEVEEIEDVVAVSS